MPVISYAQNHEDVVLRRLFPSGHQGFYIDVGANHPVHDSITRHFYEQGWHGINVEPGQIFAALAGDRSRDVNLNLGLSNSTGAMTFYEFPAYPGSSTYSAAQAEVHRVVHGFECIERQVPVSTLAALCEEHVHQPIDFLSVDVEGHERQVLEGGDWHRWRPLAVVVEATQPNTTIATHDQWEEILLAAGYLFAMFDGVNRFYLRAEDRGLLPRLAVPASVLDDFISYHQLHQAELIERAEKTIHAQKHLIGELEQAADDLQIRLAEVEELGPFCLGVARRLHGISLQFPRISARLKRLTRRAA